MSLRAAATPSPEKSCSICSCVRPLSEHLYELGYAAKLLGNCSEYESEHGSDIIKTETIGDWLQLASRLDKVNVDAWKFGDEGAFYCGTIADTLDEHTRHYTDHATALTRFIFVCNGLEETYRFIDHHYAQYVDRTNTSSNAQKRSSSLRAAALVDDLFERLGATAEPKYFDHLAGSFITLFQSYKVNHNASLSGMDPDSISRKTYALHLVRNLRNYVSHGTFRIGPPTDFGGYEDNDKLLQLLMHGSRVAALYMQTILAGFCKDFLSYDFEMMANANGEEFENFTQNCTVNYVRDIHTKGRFAFHNEIF